MNLVAWLNFGTCTSSNDEILNYRTIDNFVFIGKSGIDIFELDGCTSVTHILKIFFDYMIYNLYLWTEESSWKLHILYARLLPDQSRSFELKNGSFQNIFQHQSCLRILILKKSARKKEFQTFLEFCRMKSKTILAGTGHCIQIRLSYRH